MSGKINISDVLYDHFRTLRNERTGKVSVADILTFVGLPLLVSGLFWVYAYRLSDAAIPTIITALSIFAGLMINVLVLIYSVSQNVSEITRFRSQEDVNSEKHFLREIFANISYSILVCVVSVIILIVVMWFTGQVRVVLSALAIGLIVNFVLTLMMTVKRIHYLLGRRFK